MAGRVIDRTRPHDAPYDVAKSAADPQSYWSSPRGSTAAGRRRSSRSAVLPWAQLAGALPVVLRAPASVVGTAAGESLGAMSSGSWVAVGSGTAAQAMS